MLDPNVAYAFLRSSSFYLLERGPIIEDGGHAPGPGDRRWRAKVCPEGLNTPARPTLRWFPDKGPRPPKALLGGARRA
jgi:hypothetical protein